MFWEKGDSYKREFYSRKSYIDRRLQKDVMENGIAFIPCKVTGLDDIISKFSVKGCESVDPEFIAYITSFIDVIPLEHPLVLEIQGPEFSPEEKLVITDAITAEMAYVLGRVEADNRTLRRRFFGMIVGTVSTGVLLSFAREYLPAIPLELFYVLFWLFADSVVRYLFIEKVNFKSNKTQAGRMADIKVEFVPQPDVIPNIKAEE